MDVALAADGFGVAEYFGDRFDGLDDVLFGLLLCGESADFRKRLGGENGAGPGAEVLGGEIRTGNLAKIIVHVRRADVADVAVGVEVLKKLLSRQVLAFLGDLGEV